MGIRPRGGHLRNLAGPVGKHRDGGIGGEADPAPGYHWEAPDGFPLSLSEDSTHCLSLTRVLGILLGHETPNAYDHIAVDANRDGEVNAADVVHLMPE